MSWDDYVSVFMGKPNVADVAIFGLKDRRLWACKCESELGSTTPEQLEVLLGTDRTTFFMQGVQIGKLRCSVMRDDLDVQVMSLQTKNRDQSASVVVICTEQLIIFLMGKNAVRSNLLLTDVNDTIQGLKSAHF